MFFITTIYYICILITMFTATNNCTAFNKKLFLFIFSYRETCNAYAKSKDPPNFRADCFHLQLQTFYVHCYKDFMLIFNVACECISLLPLLFFFCCQVRTIHFSFLVCMLQVDARLLKLH